MEPKKRNKQNFHLKKNVREKIIWKRTISWSYSRDQIKRMKEKQYRGYIFEPGIGLFLRKEHLLWD